MPLARTPVRRTRLFEPASVAFMLGLFLCGIGVADAGAQTLVGSLPTNQAFGVDVEGNYAYISDGLGGDTFRILDVSNPAVPVLMGGLALGSDTRAVDTVGDFAFVAVANGLRVINVSNKNAPVQVAELGTADGLSGYGSDVLVVGTTAYLASGDVFAIDVSDPLNPALIGNSSTSNATALSVGSSPTTLYVAEYPGGVRRLDVTDPTNPNPVAYFATPGGAIEIDAVEDLVYVADQAAGLTVVDFSGVTPTQIGSYSSPGNGRGIRVRGNTAYLAAEASGVLYLDVSNPAAITLKGTASTGGEEAWDLILRDDLAYVAARYGGFKIFSAPLETSPLGLSCDFAFLSRSISVLTVPDWYGAIYNLSLVFVLENFSPTDTITDLQVAPDLDAIFGAGNWNNTSWEKYGGSANVSINPVTGIEAGSFLLPGEAVQFRLRVGPGAPGTFSGLVMATGTAGGSPVSDLATTGGDPDGADGDGNPDESASATLVFEDAYIGVAKDMNVTGSNPYTVTIDFYLKNFGLNPGVALSLQDSLDTAFGAGNYSVVSTTTVSGPVSANGGFDGSADTELISGGSINPGATAQLRTVVEVPAAGYHENSARLRNETPNGIEEGDLSVSGTDPGDGEASPWQYGPTVIALETPLVGAALDMHFTSSQPYAVAIDYTVENMGDVALTSLSTPIDLDTLFGSGNWTLLGPPSFTVSSVSLGLNPGFDGDLATELFDGGSLAPGETVVVSITVEVPTPGSYSGQFAVSAETFAATAVNDLSTAGTDPDGIDGDGLPDESDLTTVVLESAVVGLALDMASRPDLGPGRVLMTITAENLGDADLAVAELVNDLESAFGPGNFSLVGTTVTSGTLVANPAFDGSGDLNLADGLLPIGTTSTLEVDLTVPTPGEYFHQAGIYANSVLLGTAADDLSTPGPNPDPDGNGIPDEESIGSVIVERPSIGVAKTMSYDNVNVTVDLYLENLGDVTLQNLDLTDDLDAAFGAGNFTIVGPPQMVSGPATVLANANFDGSTDTGVLTGGFAAGETAHVRFLLDPGTAGSYANQAAVSAVSVFGTPLVDASVGGTDPDPNGDGVADEAGPTILDFGPVRLVASDDLFEERVSLSWTGVDDADYYYRIERNGQLLSLTGANQLNFEDTTGRPGEVYVYRVVRMDTQDVEVAFGSDTGSRRLFSPTNVSASDSLFVDGVRVSWTDRSLIEDGYAVYRREEGPDPFQLLTTIAADLETYDDDTAVAGVRYEYAVAARLGFDGEVFSAPETSALATGSTRDYGTRGFVVPPVGVSATDGDWPDRVVVTWGDESSEEDGYQVYRDGVLVETVGPNVTVWEDLAAEGSDGTVHEYCVAASQAVALMAKTLPGKALQGATQGSVQVCDEGIGGPATLAGPTEVQASDGKFDDRVEVSWTLPGATEDSVLVLRDAQVVARLLAPAASWEDRVALGAVPGTAYVYSVITKTVDGGTSAQGPDSQDSGLLSQVIPPVNVAATDGEFEDHVVISWETASTTAALFKVYRDATFFRTVARAPGVGSYQISDSGIDTAEHTWCITAVTGLGVESPLVACDTGFRRIKAPTSVSAGDRELEHIVRVTWQDGSAIEDGYRIYRKPVGADTSQYLQVGMTVANRNAFDDTTAANDTEYDYGVAAFDDLGGESARTADVGARLLKAPTDLLASDGDFETRIALRWNDDSRKEDGYRVYRRPGGSTGAFQLVSPDLPPDTVFHDDANGLVVGGSYEYEIRSFDFGGESADAFSRATGSTTFLAPAELHASTGYNQQVVLSWLDRSVTNVRYDIERDGVKIGETGGDGTRYSDTSPTAGISEYHVIAISPEGLRSEPAIAFGSALSTAPTSLAYSSSNATIHWTSLTGTVSNPLLAFDGDHLAWSRGPGQVGSSQLQTDGTWNLVTPVRWQGTLSRAVDASEFILVTGGGDDSTSVYVGSRREQVTNSWCADWGQGSGFPVNCESQILTSPHLPDLRHYGASVAIHKSLIAVGAPERRPGEAGLVDVWVRDDVNFDPYLGRQWTLEQTFDGSSYPDGLFGSSVDVDGSVAVMGVPKAPGGGRVIIAERTAPGVWSTQEIQRPAGAGGDFGARVVVDGDRLVVGSTLSPSTSAEVHVYRRDGLQNWNLETTLQAGTGFGYAIALASGRLAVGSPGQELVYVYELLADGNWVHTQDIFAYPSDGQFGIAVGWGTNGLAVMSANNIFIPFGPAEPLTDYNVTASDATIEDRVQVRWSNLPDETGFRLFRDGTEIETFPADQLRYDDMSAVPGRVYEYCVIAETPAGDVDLGCDLGRRPPDGRISGRVATYEGAGVAGVEVGIEPSFNRGVMLDGLRGEFVSERLDLHPDVNQSDFTIEFWVRGATPGVGGTPISWEQDLNSSSFGRDPVRVENLADLRLSLAGETSPSLGIDIDDGQWHHVAVTWAGRLNGIGQFWVDGVPSPTFQIGYNGMLTPGILHLGQYIGEDGIPATERAFQGEIDEFRFWSAVRTEEEILANSARNVAPDADDLAAYWTFDETSGVATPDSQNKGRFLVAANGAFITDAGAPTIATFAITDSEGNYVISASYGSATTFILSPRAPNRSFTPSYKTIVLSAQSPVQNEVSFTETTSLTLTGTIRFQAEPNCVAEGIEIRVNGIPQGQTNDLGEYELVVDFGTNVIRPVAAGREFYPAEMVLEVDQSMNALDFEELTSRALTINVGGGDCLFPIGTLRLGVVSESGCLPPTFVDVSQQEVLNLPPQKYFVYLEEILDTNLDFGTITQWFDRVGSREIDLSEGDGTLDFLYRAPLQMLVTIDADLPEGCFPGNPVIELPGGGTIPAVPVIDQGQSVPITIEVVEDYGDGNLCLVDAGTVTVYDEVLDEQDDPKVLVIRDGQAMVESGNQRSSYVTIGNTPNPAAGRRDALNNDRSFQKAITFIAEVEGQEPLTVTEWALVTGHNPRKSTFTTVSDGIPLMVLRDPPGDGSSAYIEEGTSFCTTFETAGLLSRTTGYVNKIKGGVDFTAGFGFMTDTDLDITTEGKLNVTISSNLNNQVQLCATTTEKISTSTGDAFVGDDADLFMGVGVNFVFAKTDVLELDGCRLVKSEAVAMGADGFDTVYLYTVGHIRDTVIPALRDLAAANPDRAPQLNRARLNWEAHLALNEELKAEAELQRNRSFSAGADFNYSETNQLRDTFNWDVGIETSQENSVTLGFEVAGSGTEQTFSTTMKASIKQGGSVESGNTRTVGYTLADDDQGDFFTVDIMSDGKYGTPVFDLVEGTSSCPYEEGTQPRDHTSLGINPPVLAAVSPDSIASFTVLMTNLSDSGETRDYILVPVQASNPGGAVLKLNGESFSGGIGYRLDHQTTAEAVLTVERGPTRFNYEDIELMLVPECSWNGTPKDVPGSSSVKFSVNFRAPCTDVSVLTPWPGWIHNAPDAAERDTIVVLLDNFLIDLGGGQTLTSVRATYRSNGTGPWNPIGEVTNFETDPRIGPDGSARFLWGLDGSPGVPDGNYEIRAEAKCDEGIVYSPVVRGIIDRTAPVALSLQPADNVLTVGEPIRAEFNEPLDCASVSKANVKLTNVTENVSVVIDLVCDGDGTFVITPLNPGLAAMEDDILRVDVNGVKDVAGNAVAPFNWQFTVQQSAFAWASAGISRGVSIGADGSVRAVLANGTSNDGTFVIDTGLTPFVTAVPATGLLRTGEEVEVRFDYLFDNPADIGTRFEGDVIATLDPNLGGPLPTSLLHLALDVECNASDPVVFDVAQYPYSMTIVADLDFRPTGGDGTAGDAIVAYVGSEVRGYAVVSSVSVSGSSQDLAFLTVYGRIPTGEIVRFEMVDESQCRRYLGTDRYLTFLDNATLGSPLDPEFFNARVALENEGQVTELAAGWSWLSLHVVNDDMSVPRVFGNLNPVDGDQVRSQSGAYAEYASGLGWVGDLVEFDNAQSYQVKITDGGRLLLPGSPVTPSAVLITIQQGWNWIGYTAQGPQPVGDALLALEDGRLVLDDLLRSQKSFSTFDTFNSVNSWVGSLQSMEPGLGYRLFLNQDPLLNTTFTYPQTAGTVLLAGGAGEVVTPATATGETGEVTTVFGLQRSAKGKSGTAGSGAALAGAIGADDPDKNGSQTESTLKRSVDGTAFNLDPREFEHTMTVTGKLDFQGESQWSSNQVVVALVDGQVRGIAEPLWIEGLGSHRVFLMVFSNEVRGESVAFQILDYGADETWLVDDTVDFVANGAYGRVNDPYTIVAGEQAGPTQGSPVGFQMARPSPNPFAASAGGTTIRYALPRESATRVSVYDLRGRRVEVLHDGIQSAGWHELPFVGRGLACGVYFCRIEAGDWSAVQRMTVIK